jgi:AraC-like DNA-binding protein
MLDFPRHGNCKVMPNTTIQARAAIKVLSATAEAGVAARELLSAVHLKQERLNDPDAPIPYEQYVELYEQAARLTGDDTFGLHVGESVSLRMYDVVGYATMNSATLGDALKTWIRYYRIWSNGSRTTFTIDGSVARIGYEVFDIPPRSCRQECECSQAMTVCLGRSLITADWSPREVRFQHASPANTAEHLRVFKSTIRFSCSTNEIIIDRSLLDRRIPRADTDLGRMLERHASLLLQKLPKGDGLVYHVRHLLTEALRGGDPGLPAISKRLGLSARTLQRKLKEEGTSHHDLLDELRRDLSRDYLLEPDMSIAETAFLLGFSAPSAFHRAFRRWTGMTPKQFQCRISGRIGAAR